MDWQLTLFPGKRTPISKRIAALRHPTSRASAIGEADREQRLSKKASEDDKAIAGKAAPNADPLRRNRPTVELRPDDVYDLSCRRIDDQDHIVENHDLIFPEHRVDPYDLRRCIVELEGIRNTRADLDVEMHIRPVVAVDRAVANQDAMNPGLLFARDAGEAAAVGTGTAYSSTFAGSAAKLGFTAARLAA
jgi:hypothetical protein